MDSLSSLKIDKVVYGGQGLGRCEGQVIFVPFTIDQEVVTVKLVHKKKNYTQGQLLHVIEPSPHRIKPRCSHFTHCGGCQFQHMDYPKQLETKQHILEENLARFVDRLDLYGVANHVWYYREHIKLSYEEGVLGYHGFTNKNTFALTECPIFSDQLTPTLKILTTTLKRSNCQAGSVRILKSGTRFIVALECDSPIQGDLSPLLDHVQGICLKQGGKILELGDCRLTQTYLGTLFHMDPWSFMQAHSKMAESLYQHILSLIPQTTTTLVDLYCGAGILSILAAKKYPHLTIYGLELNPRAIVQAHKNQKEHNLPDIHLIAAPAEQVLTHVKERIDFVIVNPPREGLSAAMLKALIHMKDAQFCYVSCNPTTLQRDLKALIVAGYRVTSISGFDLFPQTTHLETVCLIEKGDDFQSSP